MSRRFVFVPLFAIALAIAAPLAASAGVPDPNWSTWPRHIDLVGRDAAGASDVLGTLDFHITRIGGTVESGFALIVLDYSSSPGIRICAQQDPGVVVACDAGGSRYVRVIADGHGRASFRIVGHSDRLAGGANTPTVTIYADGVLFGTIPIATYDEDGGGLGPADNSLWQADYFSSLYWERSDFDGDGVLGPSDLSQWLTAYFGNGSIFNCTTQVACP